MNEIEQIDEHLNIIRCGPAVRSLCTAAGAQLLLLTRLLPPPLGHREMQQCFKGQLTPIFNMFPFRLPFLATILVRRLL